MKRRDRIDRRTFLGSLIAAPLFVRSANAQQFPNKPIRFVVPYAAGGSTDVASRMVAEEMSAILGQPIIVENRLGAGGVLGIDFVARSQPDGYTMGAGGSAVIVLPFILGPVPSFGTDDVVPIGQICLSEFVVLARKDFPASTTQELIAQAKANPKKFRYGEAGAAIRLGMEMFISQSGVDIVRVPYKGDALVLTDVMGGHVDLGSTVIGSAAEQIKANTVKPIAVMSKVRSRALPNVPTIAEAGLTGFEAGAATMLLVPKSTPLPAMEKLNAALNEALRKPNVVEKYASVGLAAQPMTLKEAQDLIANEREKSAKIVKDANIPVEK